MSIQTVTRAYADPTLFTDAVCDALENRCNIIVSAPACTTVETTRKAYAQTMAAFSTDIDPQYIYDGFLKVSAISGMSEEQFITNISQLDSKAESYCAQKALIKAARILAIIGGADDTCIRNSKLKQLADKYVQNAFRTAIDEYFERTRVRAANGRFTKELKATEAACIPMQLAKESIGYKALIDARANWRNDTELNAEIDRRIERGDASFATSTINTQACQIKGVLQWLKVAHVEVNGIKVEGRGKSKRNQTIVIADAFCSLLLNIDATTYHFKRMDSAL